MRIGTLDPIINKVSSLRFRRTFFRKRESRNAGLVMMRLVPRHHLRDPYSSKVYYSIISAQ